MLHMYIVKMRLCHLGDNATGYLSKTSIPGTRNPPLQFLSEKSRSLPNNVGSYCCCLLPPELAGSSYCGRHHTFQTEPGRTKLVLSKCLLPRG